MKGIGENTPPKTAMKPENSPLEKEKHPTKNHQFLDSVLVFGGVHLNLGYFWYQKVAQKHDFQRNMASEKMTNPKREMNLLSSKTCILQFANGIFCFFGCVA